MARETRRAPLGLSDAHRQMLTELGGSRTAPAREVERAKVLLRYADGISISDIQRQVGVSRPTIYKCIDKALSAGVQVGLKDTFHSPKEPEILADAKAWVVNLACTKPKDHGLAAELWTLSALVRQVRKCAVDAGFPRLAEVGKTSVWRILNEQNIKPHRVRYYKRTPHPVQIPEPTILPLALVHPRRQNALKLGASSRPIAPTIPQFWTEIARV